MYKKYIKRFGDMVLSIIGLIILSPVFIIVAFLVRIKLGSPIIYKQNRPGLNEKIFEMYKFRTMSDGKDSEGMLLPDEKRLNKFGKLLRSTSLDELPELLNIIKGDMSIIGPRPLLIEYLPYYTEVEKKRHLVRPGLTGKAQISGRNAISWEEKFKLDVYYAENISFKEDFGIFWKTIFTVIKHEGIGQAEEAPMDFNLERTIINKNKPKD